jgi:DNA-binding TFAR19-related protein (PDSD5 family)
MICDLKVREESAVDERERTNLHPVDQSSRELRGASTEHEMKRLARVKLVRLRGAKDCELWSITQQRVAANVEDECLQRLPPLLDKLQVESQKNFIAALFGKHGHD